MQLLEDEKAGVSESKIFLLRKEDGWLFENLDQREA